MKASFESISNHSKDTIRAAFGNISFIDAQRRSTGMVPACTGMPAACSANATILHFHNPASRNG